MLAGTTIARQDVFLEVRWGILVVVGGRRMKTRHMLPFHGISNSEAVAHARKQPYMTMTVNCPEVVPRVAITSREEEA